MFGNSMQMDGTTRTATTLIISLRGDVPEILQSFPDERQDNLQLLCENLDRRFGNKHMPSLHRTEFKNRRDSATETLQEFCTDLSHLVILIFSTAPGDALHKF